MLLDLQYSEPVFRPPSEARSLILQATIGCSHNKCKFCGMYKMKDFRIRKFDDFRKDVDTVAGEHPGIRRVFLADGDALIIKTELMLKILSYLYQSFPRLERVTAYANPSNILQKNKNDLKMIRNEGLTILYLGVESGDNDLLARVDKGATRAEIVESGRKAIEAGFTLSTTVIIGLGGKAGSERHARDTATILNEIQPHYIGALMLMLQGLDDYFAAEVGGNWEPLNQEEFLRELKILVEGLNLRDSVFRSNHASNYLPLGGDFPRDKEKLLKTIDYALDHPEILRPEFMRAL